MPAPRDPNSRIRIILCQGRLGILGYGCWKPLSLNNLRLNFCQTVCTRCENTSKPRPTLRTTSEPHPNHVRTTSEPHPKQWQKLREKRFLGLFAADCDHCSKQNLHHNGLDANWRQPEMRLARESGKSPCRADFLSNFWGFFSLRAYRSSSMKFSFPLKKFFKEI